MAENGFFRSKQGFTVVQNAIVREKAISLGAKGLYLLIQAYITMPNKVWFKKDFIKMCSDGAKSFDGAWRELKEQGYLKIHKKMAGNKFVIEYELLDEPVDGPHTFFYNSKGEITSTNLGKLKSSDDKQEECATIRENEIEEEGLQDIVAGKEEGTISTKCRLGSVVKGDFLEGDFPKGSVLNGCVANNKYNINTTYKDLDLKPVDNNPKDFSFNLSAVQLEKTTNERIRERINRLKENVEYESRKRKEKTEEFELFDALVNVIIDCISNPPTGLYIHIANKDRTYEDVVDTFMRLKFEYINCTRNKLKNLDLSKVTSFKPYVLTILFNIAEIPESALREKRKTNWDIEEHDYDFDMLEKCLCANE